jgi:membrane-associated phospholipid phosphatase
MFLILATASISQLPKRFVWRMRPWMCGRARTVRINHSLLSSPPPSNSHFVWIQFQSTKEEEEEGVFPSLIYSKEIFFFINLFLLFVVGCLQVRKDRTSGFPSRAVSCSVVYSYTAMLIVEYSIDESNELWRWHWYTIVTFLMAVLGATYARVHVGAHFPSDCLMGVVQGIVTSIAGTLLFHLDLYKCAPCHNNACYTSVHETHIEWSTLKKLDWTVFMIITLVGVAFAIASAAPPLYFWAKSHLVFGVTFASLAFQLLFVCPSCSSYNISLPQPRCPHIWSYAYALCLGGSCVFLGARAKGKPLVSVITFVGLYVAVLLGISCWRLQFVKK